VRYRNKGPLDRVIQYGLIRRQRKAESRCIDCGNWCDGKAIDGVQETGPGALNIDTDEWLCHRCQQRKNDRANEAEG